MNINGIWEGEYTYGTDYPASVIGTKVSFRVSLSTNGSEIEGTFTDEQTLDMFPQGGILTGVYENTFISLSLQYPYAWSFTETGERLIEKNRPPHIIEHEGFFDAGKFEGEWEIPLIETNESGELCLSATETSGKGTWWLKKIE